MVEAQIYKSRIEHYSKILVRYDKGKRIGSSCVWLVTSERTRQAISALPDGKGKCLAKCDLAWLIQNILNLGHNFEAHPDLSFNLVKALQK